MGTEIFLKSLKLYLNGKPSLAKGGENGEKPLCFFLTQPDQLQYMIIFKAKKRDPIHRYDGLLPPEILQRHGVHAICARRKDGLTHLSAVTG
ncbi:MAG: hypothetical protein CSB33_03360 [Desulfobacterales bacterium]|nr:MAG: hypothetical protein CSB33_03360 [Desulfobacterales bacterium]